MILIYFLFEIFFSVSLSIFFLVSQAKAGTFFSFGVGRFFICQIQVLLVIFCNLEQSQPAEIREVAGSIPAAR